MTNNKEKIIKIIDFWQKSVEGDNLHNRALVSTINLDSKEIVDIIGARRSGKSSIFKLIIKQLHLKDEYLFINFEDPYFLENNDAGIIEDIIDVYKEYFNKDLKYLFFDEIQSINNWEKALRKLRDGTNYKIFITGSSSQLLSKEISSMITGRHLSYSAFPLSFKEYLYFNKIIIKGKKDIALKKTKIEKGFINYMQIGGFPEVVLTKNKELLKDYFYDFLQKDVAIRHEVRDPGTLERVALFLISNSSKIYSIESIKKTFSISYDTARDYVDYLKEAFLVFELKQFSHSLKKQSKAQKKIYTIDTGLAEAVSFRFSQDSGRVLENVIFLELIRQGLEVFYYKTSNNLEVDFLVKDGTEVKDLIQVSFDISDQKTRDRELNALKQAMVELDVKEATLITINDDEELVFDGKMIKIVPAWRWLLYNE